MKTTIKSIATGTAQTYQIGEKTFQSAYKKDNYTNDCTVNILGIEEDFQVDKRFHGGRDKAIHIGSSKHFDSFKKLYDTTLHPLAIGCNIFINDYDESDVCVGDIYSIGELIVEVTQPRQPCWKIGALFDKETSRYISQKYATGWYVRILKTGKLKKDSPFKLEKRVSNITIKELSIYLKMPPVEDEKLIKEILNTKALAKSYKDDFQNSLRNC